jgi:hypothetical protein
MNNTWKPVMNEHFQTEDIAGSGILLAPLSDKEFKTKTGKLYRMSTVQTILPSGTIARVRTQFYKGTTGYTELAVGDTIDLKGNPGIEGKMLWQQSKVIHSDIVDISEFVDLLQTSPNAKNIEENME